MLKRMIVLIGACTLIFLCAMPSAAREATVGGTGVTIVPPSFELYGNPGDSLTERIKVRNDSDAEMRYSLLVEDFKAVGEEGGVGLIDDDQSNSTYSLAKWVFPEPKSFTLAAGQEKEISFSINIPKNAEPGGKYGSILVKIGEEGKVQSGASVSSRVGSLILLRVSGNVKEEASVASFKTDKGYYEKGPISFMLRVKNTGNNHIRPKGTIVVSNIFGQKVAQIDLNGKNVLPGAIRKMDTEWKPKGMLANRYTATLVATYGQSSGQSLSSSVSFIVFPKYMIVLMLIGILALVGAISGRKSIKKSIHKLTK
jgi:hypothetical protein